MPRRKEAIQVGDEALPHTGLSCPGLCGGVGAAPHMGPCQVACVSTRGHRGNHKCGAVPLPPPPPLPHASAGLDAEARSVAPELGVVALRCETDGERALHQRSASARGCVAGDGPSDDYVPVVYDAVAVCARCGRSGRSAFSKTALRRAADLQVGIRRQERPLLCSLSLIHI